MPCVLNAANEVAVEAFLSDRIPFTGITRIVADTMSGHEVREADSIEGVLRASEWAKQKAEELVLSNNGK
jgi:1-deoxy-D-xylulose-5-phosphate reductoisomerase